MQLINQGGGMNKLIKNQAGFGAVGIILIVLVIGVIGVTGWYVWRSIDKGSTENNSANRDGNTHDQVDPLPDPTEGGRYLVIREWSIRIPLTDELKGGTYIIEDDDTASLHLELMADKANDCSSQVVIKRYSNEGLANSDLAESVKESIKQDWSYSEGKYYVAIGSQAACSQDQTIQVQADMIRREWVRAVKEIESFDM